MLTTFVSFGDDFASSTLDVVGTLLLSFNPVIILAIGAFILAGVIAIIIKALMK